MPEYLDKIEFADISENELIAKLPSTHDTVLRLGGRLIVKDHQRALLVGNGKALDVFGPGEHILVPSVMPNCVNAGLIRQSDNSITAEVVFINAKPLTDKKWGTRTPILFPDREFGAVAIRAFGSYGIRIVQPLVFVNTLVLTRQLFTGKLVEDYLRDLFAGSCTEHIAKGSPSIRTMNDSYTVISEAILPYSAESLKKFGIELREFSVTNISLPDEVLQLIDEGKQHTADEYVRDAVSPSQNSEGAPAHGTVKPLDIGAGLGMLLPGMMYGAQQVVSNGVIMCPQCNEQVTAGNKFCPKCGKSMTAREERLTCPSCHAMIPNASHFCPKCGVSLSQKTCTGCGATIDAGDVFCPQCGKKN